MRTTLIFSIFFCLLGGISCLYGQENIALDKPVSMSSIDGAHEGFYAVDGVDTINFEAATGWIQTFKGQYQWVQIDLEAQYEINQVRLSKKGLSRMYIPAVIANDYLMVSISDDPEFKGIYNPAQCRSMGLAVYSLNSQQPLSITTIPKGFKGRYVRIWDGNHGGIYLTEIEIRGKLSEDAAKIALQSGNTEQAKTILQKQAAKGGNFNQAENLRMAIDQRNPELVETVLSSGNSYVSAATFEYALNTNYNSRLVQQMLTSGDVEISATAASTAIKKKDPVLINKMLTESPSSFASRHVDEAMMMGSPEIAKAIMMKSKITPGPSAMNAAVNSGNMLLVSDMINKYGGSPNSAMLSTAIRTQNQALTNLLLPKVKPNSEAYVLAAQQNDNELYANLVENKPLSDNNSIHIAIDKGNTRIVKSGLSNGGNVNQALDYAISRNKPEMVSYIVGRKGADVNKAIPYSIRQNNKTLFNSILNEHNGDATKALDASIKAKKTDFAVTALETGQADGTKYLASTVADGNVILAKKIVELGGDPDAGMEAAIKINNVSLVEYFIGFGASVSDPKLMASAGSRSLPIVRMLVEGGAQPDDGIGAASGAGKLEIVNYLLDHAANPSKGIQRASLSGKDQVLEVLLENGGDPNLGIKEAVKGNHGKSVRVLLDGGASASDPALIGIAASKNNPVMVADLIDFGAEPENGLSSAALFNGDKALEVLIDKGANANHAELVKYAVDGSAYRVIPMLAAAGNDMEYAQADGSSYLHLSIHKVQDLNTITALLEAGVPPNMQDNRGNTALHLAAMKGKAFIPIIQALGSKGADPNIANHAGKTPRKVAKGGKTKNALKKLGGSK